MPSSSTVKKFVFAFDLICTLIALVLLAFGIYVLCSYRTNDLGSIAAYVYIGVGAAALVVIALGCLAAMREHVCCTITFVVLLYVVIIAQIVAVYLMTKSKHNVASNLANVLDNAWEEELKSPGAMSIYENWFECCGRGSPQDYIVNERLPPATCFKNNDDTNADNLIDTGCRIEFENYWIDLLNGFNILAWVLIALEIFGSIVSCCLCNTIRNERRRLYI